MKYFSPELRTASVVPRWSIVWTLTRDVLSNHSFFVTIYADQIAELIGWYNRTRPLDNTRGNLLFLAITHDLDETITGDIVAPAKRAILDTNKATDYIDANMEERLPWVVENTKKLKDETPILYKQIKQIVKAADRLDALLFLTVEARLGNGVIVPRLPECAKSFYDAWFELPSDKETLTITLEKHVQPAIDAHRTTGGYGI